MKDTGIFGLRGFFGSVILLDSQFEKTRHTTKGGGYQKMHTTNYTNAFIAVAEDCPVLVAKVPQPKGGQHTIASLQYELIRKNPYKFTSDDVIFQVFAEKNELTKSSLDSERMKFFSKGQACLRSSPLAKRYGWGVHSDDQGRVAIYALESADYKTLSKDKTITQIKAMRSKRAD